MYSCVATRCGHIASFGGQDTPEQRVQAGVRTVPSLPTLGWGMGMITAAVTAIWSMRWKPYTEGGRMARQRLDPQGQQSITGALWLFSEILCKGKIIFLL